MRMKKLTVGKIISVLIGLSALHFLLSGCDRGEAPPLDAAALETASTADLLAASRPAPSDGARQDATSARLSPFVRDGQPYVGPAVQQAVRERIDAQNERERENNRLRSVRKCDETNGCGMTLSFVSPEAANRAALERARARELEQGGEPDPGRTDLTPTPLPTDSKTYPYVNGSGVLVESTRVGATFQPSQCSVKVEVEGCATGTTATAEPALSPASWKKFEAVSVASVNLLQPGQCPDAPTQINEWLNTDAARAYDFVVCACPKTTGGQSTCPDAGEGGFYAFQIGLLNHQARYRVTVNCAGYEGSIAYAGTFDGCLDPLSGETALTQHFLDGDGDVYYAEGQTPAESNPAYFGSFCATLPLQTCPATSQRNAANPLNLAGLSESSDGNDTENPSTMDFSESAPFPAAAADAGAQAGETNTGKAQKTDGTTAEAPKGYAITAASAWFIGDRTTDSSGTLETGLGTRIEGNLDLNGDGCPDLAFAAPETDLSRTSGSLTERARGRVYVVLGACDFTSGRQVLPVANLGLPVNGPGQAILSNSEQDRAVVVLEGIYDLGYAGRGLVRGDFNGDGFGDLAIGVPGDLSGYNPMPGRVFVLFGSAWANPAAGPFGVIPLDLCSLHGLGISTVLLESTGNSSGRFGEVLSSGDLDLDGQDELIVGAPNEGSSGAYGRTYVFTGDELVSLKQTADAAFAAGTCGALTLDLPSAQEHARLIFTSAVAGAPVGTGALVLADPSGSTVADFTGDGVPDLALDARTWSDSSGALGRVLIYQGDTDFSRFFTAGSTDNGVDIAPDLILEGDHAKAMWNLTLRFLPDVSGDGEVELVLGTPYHTAGAVTEAGMVYVLLSELWLNRDETGVKTGSVLKLPTNATTCTARYTRCLPGSQQTEHWGGSLDTALGATITGGHEVLLAAGAANWLDTGTQNTTLSGRVVVMALEQDGQTGSRLTSGWGSSGLPARWSPLTWKDSYGTGLSIRFVGNLNQDALGTPELLTSASWSYYDYMTTTQASNLNQAVGQPILYLKNGGMAF